MIRNTNGRPGVHKGSASKFNWTRIKRDFISDPTMTKLQLQKKYGVSSRALNVRFLRDNWELLREEVQRKAELALAEEAQNDVLEVKKRHVRIARLMQKIGIEALETHKYLPKNSKEAREFIVEGVKMEKGAMGLDEKKPIPALIGIVERQKQIIGQYEEGIIVKEELPNGKESI